MLKFICLFGFTILAAANAQARSCIGIGFAKFPAEDKPKNFKTLKNCDSESLYYGIGRPKDFKKARECAFYEVVETPANLFSGQVILMMIYANGEGVKQNIPLAEQLACEIGGAPAEIEGRMEHLEDLKLFPAKGRFDYCDDITSGRSAGECSAHHDRSASVDRKSKLKMLMSKWTSAEKIAFNPLQKASAKFTEDRSSQEVDMTGTMRSAFVIREEAIQESDFIESLEKLEKGKAPHYSPAEMEKEKIRLKTALERVRSAPEAATALWGTVNKENIALTQASWNQYRDAWVQFAKVKYPKETSENISTWFTKKRAHMLESILR